MRHPDLPSIIAAIVATLPPTGCLPCSSSGGTVAFKVVDAPIRSADVDGSRPLDAYCEQLCFATADAESMQNSVVLSTCSIVPRESGSGDTGAGDGGAGDGGAGDGVGAVGDEDPVIADLSCEALWMPPCEGRRPLGHVERSGEGRDPVGRTLATLAHLEAAAVYAFVELSEILARHGAPGALLERCARAAADERRHAAALTALAVARGASVPRPAATSPRRAGLFEVAVLNAAEGCVHEAWAALEAAIIARSSDDPGIAAAFARISVDEARHAGLSWDLHAWLRTRLGPGAWGVVEQALASALARLPERAERWARQLPGPLRLPGPARPIAELLVRRLAG